MNGRGNSMELGWTYFHGNHEHRNGVLGHLDVHMVKGGQMREAIIISVILILAVLMWMPRKGGKQ